jgi:hypothetical protein
MVVMWELALADETLEMLLPALRKCQRFEAANSDFRQSHSRQGMGGVVLFHR